MSLSLSVALKCARGVRLLFAAALALSSSSGVVPPFARSCSSSAESHSEWHVNAIQLCSAQFVSASTLDGDQANRTRLLSRCAIIVRAAVFGCLECLESTASLC